MSKPTRFHPDMTLRDYLALVLCPAPNWYEAPKDENAAEADYRYEWADAMLARRSEPKE